VKIKMEIDNTWIYVNPLGEVIANEKVIGKING
jgi:hypothetical protein